AQGVQRARPSDRARRTRPGRCVHCKRRAHRRPDEDNDPMKLRVIPLLFATASAAAQAGPPAPHPANGLYLGGDLSYVNEMEDCGAIYRLHGKPVDAFKLLK